jgi:hypothetical protein
MAIVILMLSRRSLRRVAKNIQGQFSQIEIYKVTAAIQKIVLSLLELQSKELMSLG